jgi:hypothetical protein
LHRTPTFTSSKVLELALDTLVPPSFPVSAGKPSRGGPGAHSRAY